MKEDLLVQKPRAGKSPAEKRLLSPRTPQTAGAGFITPISATSPGWGGLFSYGPGCYLDKGSTKPSLWPEVLASLSSVFTESCCLAWVRAARRQEQPGEPPPGPQNRLAPSCSALSLSHGTHHPAGSSPV